MGTKQLKKLVLHFWSQQSLVLEILFTRDNTSQVNKKQSLLYEEYEGFFLHSTVTDGLTD